MYGNPYLNPYVPAWGTTPAINQPVTQPMPTMEIQKVHGEESAKAYPMGPNSSVILLDTVDPLIWVVTTDASGFKTVSAFDVFPHVQEKQATTNDLKSELEGINIRLDRLEERMTENEQSGNGISGQNKWNNANAKSNVRNGQSGQGPSGGDHAAVAK